MTKQYRCPGCGTNDPTLYWRCNMPDCPDGHDQQQRREATPNVIDYSHNALYVYDAMTQTFDPFVQRGESWAAWLGRRTADGVFVVGGYYVLKWLGIIVHVTVQS